MVRHTSTAPGPEEFAIESFTSSRRIPSGWATSCAVSKAPMPAQTGRQLSICSWGARQTMSPGLPMKSKRPPEGTTMRETSWESETRASGASRTQTEFGSLTTLRPSTTVTVKISSTRVT